MITKIPKTYRARSCNSSFSHTVMEFYCLSTDEKPTDGVKNADILFLMDWKNLTDEQKSAAVAQVWMFDQQNNQWLPQ